MIRTRVYLDTKVFIAAYEARGMSNIGASALLAALDAGRIDGVTSELTLAELLVGPLRTARNDLVDAYKALLVESSGLALVPVSRPILEDAALARALRTALKLPDAIHVATAARSACGYCATGDARLGLAPGMVQLRLSALPRDVPGLQS